MEVCCFFKVIVGEIYGFDVRDRKKEIQVILLLLCLKDIFNYLVLYLFIGLENEIDLILCCVVVFKMLGFLDRMIICFCYCGKLGLGWMRVFIRCRILFVLFNYGKGCSKIWLKGDRGVGKEDFEMVLRLIGVFI